MAREEVLRRVASSAGEVIITLVDYVPEDLLRALEGAKKRRGIVQVLTWAGFPDRRYLIHLAGLFNLYQAVIPRRSYVFIDRREGYELPDYKPVENPYSRACDLMLRRLGHMIALEGRVGTRLEAISFLKLEKLDKFWIPYTGSDRIGIGDRIRVLGIASFLSHPPYILKVLDVERLGREA